ALAAAAVTNGGAPATAEAVEPGEVQQVELLEDFLAANTIRSVLQPVVNLRRGGAPFEVFGVEGLARGPTNAVLGNPVIFLGYAAHKEMLFKADMICIQ